MASDLTTPPYVRLRDPFGRRRKGRTLREHLARVRCALDGHEWTEHSLQNEAGLHDAIQCERCRESRVEIAALRGYVAEHDVVRN